jgi:hypothetical protein
VASKSRLSERVTKAGPVDRILVRITYSQEQFTYQRKIVVISPRSEVAQTQGHLAESKALNVMECIRGHWSVRALRRQIATLYFERSSLSRDKQKLSELAQSAAGWALQRTLLEHLESIWDKPDRGMWEVRGEPQHFTYSKVMTWVAVDRAIKSAEQFKLEGSLDRWKAWRVRIHDEVCRNGFDSGLGAFVQSYGSKKLDASVLLIPLVGFLPPRDPRVRSTVEAIERHLTLDGFVLRYDTSATSDGLPLGEGAFLACSFWLADNLVLLNRRRDARRLFERLISLRNDVGLLSEEYDPRGKRFVGNFPQAFSHVALVNTAHNLTRDHGPARQRASNNRVHYGRTRRRR